MLSSEIKSTLLIGLVFASRMLGAFMVFPVLVLYANAYPDASLTLVGLALGGYGLFQALLQLPMAALSDRFGRKPLIIVGLAVFALGALVSAFSTTLMGVAIGRAIQGSGAIGATLLAFVSDSTRDVVRTKAMAILGILIGSAFTLSLIIGPLLDNFLGLQGLFFMTAMMAVVALVLIVKMPEMDPPRQRLSFAPRALFEAIFSAQLGRLYLSIFTLHAVLTMLFLVIPTQVQILLGLSKSQSWQFYIPVLLLSLVCIVPFLKREETALQQYRTKGAILGLLIIVPAWLWTDQTFCFAILGVLFFTAFNFLEASLPAMVSQMAPASRRGLILGVYSSFQFLGLFVGGTLGGVLLDRWGHWGIVVMSVMMISIWLWSMQGVYLTQKQAAKLTTL